MKAGIAAGGGAALPGLMMNLNKSYKDFAHGQESDVKGGRLECTMQVHPGPIVPFCRCLGLPLARKHVSISVLAEIIMSFPEPDRDEQPACI